LLTAVVDYPGPFHAGSSKRARHAPSGSNRTPSGDTPPCFVGAARSSVGRGCVEAGGWGASVRGSGLGCRGAPACGECAGTQRVALSADGRPQWVGAQSQSVGARTNLCGWPALQLRCAAGCSVPCALCPRSALCASSPAATLQPVAHSQLTRPLASCPQASLLDRWDAHSASARQTVAGQASGHWPAQYGNELGPLSRIANWPSNRLGLPASGPTEASLRRPFCSSSSSSSSLAIANRAHKLRSARLIAAPPDGH